MHVLYGAKSGLGAQGSQWFARNSPGVPGALATGDYVGHTVRLRDTDRDGMADLYVMGDNSSLRLPGTSKGVTTTGVQQVNGDVVTGMLQ